MAEATTTEAPAESGEIESINGVPIDDNGMAISQPEEAEQAEAVEETTKEQQEAEATEEPSTEETTESTEEVVDTEDEQLAKFAATKGLELDSENAKKAAKMAMNAEKLMHSKTKQASEMERTMSAMSDASAEQVAEATGQDPEVLKRLQRMEVKDSIRDFWDTNPDARNYESEMAEIAQTSGLYGSPEAILKASYAIARSNDSANLKSQGKQEALKSLAHKQQAAVPTGNAVTSTISQDKITPQNVDKLVGEHDLAWFESHRDEINKAMAL